MKCAMDNCNACNSSRGVQWCNDGGCAPGYRLNVGSSELPAADQANYQQVCEKCEENCLDCTVNRKVCAKCKEGYILNNGVCLNYPNNCAELYNGTNGDQSKCRVCNYGFRVSDGRCLSGLDPYRGWSHVPEGIDVSGNLWFTSIDVTGWNQARDKELRSGPNGSFGAAPIAFSCLSAALLIFAFMF